ncbi:uncharacterized protein LOC143451263 [Clavelina lepadiformis]|uniref:uncharacterized protein LOC143451263 n=1 Tax=Clavelina lepadiformis TaxID=159417 RepID=UPI004041F2D2
MKTFGIILSVLLLGVLTANGQDEQNAGEISGSVAARAVVLTWNHVEGATHYLVVLDGQSQNTTDTTASFGGLEPNTPYTAEASAFDANGSIIFVFPDFTFETVLERITNLRAKDITEISIEITWDERNDTTVFSVMVKDDEDELLEPFVRLSENTAFISGLQRLTFYNIYVAPVGADGVGETSVIRLRTDGEGVRIVNSWKNSEGLSGGQVMIYRSINIPRGPYMMRVFLPCPATNIKVWNADIDEELSSQDDGIYILVQNKIWQKRKADIGMNFYSLGDETFNCSIEEGSVNVEFSYSEPSARNVLSSNQAIPVSILEWATIDTGIVSLAGKMNVRLDEVYDNVNAPLSAAQSNQTFNMKPYHGQFIIALHSGEDCPGGISIGAVWGMTQKSSTGMEGALPSTMYFVQTEAQWPSNEIGLIYGYDADNCSSRNGVTTELIEGGPIVDAVFDAEDV